MIYTPLISKAVKYAIKVHEQDQKQKRKGKDIAYVTHPLTVGLILSRAGCSETAIVAGILHDCIEDSSPDSRVTKEMIEQDFGKEVADTVDFVTEQDKSLPWEERKHKALERISSFSHDAVLVKSADLISNSTELFNDYDEQGDEVFARFNAGKDRVLGHHIQTIDTLTATYGDSPLKSDLDIIRKKLHELVRTKLINAGAGIYYIRDEITKLEGSSYIKLQVDAVCTEIIDEICNFDGTRIDEVVNSINQKCLKFKKIVEDIEKGPLNKDIYMLLIRDVATVLSILNETEDFETYMANKDKKPKLKPISPEEDEEGRKIAQALVDNLNRNVRKQYGIETEKFHDSSSNKILNNINLCLIPVKGELETYDVILLNSSSMDFTNVKSYTGGFASDDDNLIETSRSVNDLGELKSNKYIEIERTNGYDRDFVIWYHFDFATSNGEVIKAWGEIPKYFQFDKDKVIVPIINKEGLIVQLDERKDGISIDEKVKNRK